MDEEQYDAEVAPLLLSAAKKAQSLGGTVLCFAEWGESHDNGRTTIMSSPSAHAQMVDCAMRCKGNIDAFAIALLQAHESGKLDLSQTMFLQMFGKSDAA